MNRLKILFSIIFIISFVMCGVHGYGQSVNSKYIPKQIQKSITDSLPVNPAMTFVKNMGIGINIGNTLDAIGTHDWHSGENGWGNPNISRDFIRALKNHGYKTIRLPVTWAEYIGPAPDYKIGTCVFDDCNTCPNRMNRVEEVVKWIIAEDMYCILNLHHDGGHSDKSWILDAGDNPEKIADMFAKIWKQIAARFAGISQDKLIFESMNEVGFNTLYSRSKKRAYDTMNTLNQIFTDTVRQTPGNEDRFLLIAGYYTDIDRTIDAAFKMPADTISNRLILSVHFYNPADFTIAESNTGWGFRNNWGAAADYQEILTQFNKLRRAYLNKGIPVILGEYGVTLLNKIEDDRIKWMAAVTQTCLNYGVCPVLWDTGWKIDDKGKDFGGEVSREPPYALRNALKTVLSVLIQGD